MPKFTFYLLLIWLSAWLSLTAQAQVNLYCLPNSSVYTTYTGSNGACMTTIPTEGRVYMNFGSNCNAANQDVATLQNDCGCCPIFRNDCIRYTNTDPSATSDVFVIRGITYTVTFVTDLTPTASPVVTTPVNGADLPPNTRPLKD